MGALRRLVRLVITPYRQRISVQLIVSHVLVVLVTTALVGVVTVGATTGWLRFNQSTPSTGQLALVDEARALATLTGPSTLRQIAEEGPSGEARAALTAKLDGLVSSLGRSGATIDPAFALVVDRSGTVVASSDPARAGVGSTLSAVRSPLVARLSQRLLELDGRPTGWGNPWIFDTEGGAAAAAYPVLDESGSLVGVVALESPRGSAEPAIPWKAMILILVGTSLMSAALMIVPALIVSIPVGVLRARSFSRRLSQLATAADAMAAGDLSRRVRVEGEDEIAHVSERFNEMVASLEHSDRARRAFVANVSHDLRTPVAVIRGYTERLLERCRTSAAVPVGDTGTDSDTAALEVIHREVLMLSRLIDDLFTLARLDEAALPLEPTAVRLQDVAEHVVKGVQGVAWGQRKVTVRSLVPADLPPVRADRTRVQQVFGNLIFNALRHTPEGGLVVVDARVADRAVEVSISDTGPGISEEEQALVFERFYRSSRDAENRDGAGLGLAIVRQLVEAQRGRISVESHPGEGTTFRFTLPLASG